MKHDVACLEVVNRLSEQMRVRGGGGLANATVR